ncbi:MAG TPA: ABC transporter ATP-binding protein [Gammaproteobacteria bacterium]|nr:ABC transporter ATP-binding protein [Gammaproteobacteria bacterium]
MSSEIAIKVENLSKCYQVYDQPRDRLKQFFMPRLQRAAGIAQKQYYREFWALKDVSFNVKKGEIIGIVGPNGAGKSTLLQILCNTLAQTDGVVSTKGRISALLELGSGFNPEFSGIENIHLNGAILGLSQEEIIGKIPEIMEFADIGDFIYQPVKNYSSGMYARLAFAVAVSVEPEILVVDETLAVGDMLFQAKAIQRMRDLMDRCTVLFVSHSLATVKSFCNRAILIDQGQIIRDGRAPEVCDQYEMMMQERLLARGKLTDSVSLGSVSRARGSTDFGAVDADPNFPESGGEFRSGSGALRVVRGDLMINGRLSSQASLGDQLTLRLVIIATRSVKAGAIVGYMVRNANAVDVFGRNLYNERQSLPAMTAGQKVVVEFSFPCLLSQGRYSISLGVKSEPHLPEFFDSIHVARAFEVSGASGNYVPGLIYVENEIKISSLVDSI